jgi:hypothetical protein
MPEIMAIKITCRRSRSTIGFITFTGIILITVDISEKFSIEVSLSIVPICGTPLEKITSAEIKLTVIATNAVIEYKTTNLPPILPMLAEFVKPLKLLIILKKTSGAIIIVIAFIIIVWIGLEIFWLNIEIISGVAKNFSIKPRIIPATIPIIV